MPFYPLAVSLLTREVRWTLIANSTEQRRKWAADIRLCWRRELERERKERSRQRGSTIDAPRHRGGSFLEKWERILQTKEKRMSHEGDVGEGDVTPSNNQWKADDHTKMELPKESTGPPGHIVTV